MAKRVGALRFAPKQINVKCPKCQVEHIGTAGKRFCSRCNKENYRKDIDRTVKVH